MVSRPGFTSTSRSPTDEDDGQHYASRAFARGHTTEGASLTIDPRHLGPPASSTSAARLVANASAVPATSSPIDLDSESDSETDDSTSNHSFATTQLALSNVFAANSSATRFSSTNGRRLYRNSDWSASEDDLLRHVYRSYGSQGWQTVTREFNKRSKGPSRNFNGVSSRGRKLRAEAASSRSESPSQGQQPRPARARHNQDMAASSSALPSSTARPRTSAVAPVHRTRSSTSSLPSQRISARTNIARRSTASTASTSSNSPSMDGLSLEGLSATAILSIPSAPNGGRWPPWSLSETKLLIRCLQNHGERWAKVEDAFRAAGGTRGRGALQRRYEKLCEAAAKERRAAQPGQGSSSRQRATIAPAPASSTLSSPPQVLVHEGHSAEGQEAFITCGQQPGEGHSSAPSQPSQPEEEDTEMTEYETASTELTSPQGSTSHGHNTTALLSMSTLRSRRNVRSAPTGVTHLKSRVSGLDHGYRFDNMKANLTLCVYTQGYYEFHSPAIKEIVPGSSEENAHFVFSILADGSLLTLGTPPGTRYHAVWVDADGKEVDRQSRLSGRVQVVGIEHRFRTPGDFLVIFFEPL